MSSKELVPNKDYWKQELIIRNKAVNLKNKTSPLDKKRYTSIKRIANEDKILDVEDDNYITLGKRSEDFNIMILIPKTEKRAADKGVTIEKLIMDRTENPEIRKTLID